MTFGPFEEGLPEPERQARTRAFLSIVMIMAPKAIELHSALRDGERDPDSLRRAAALLEQIPALNRRRVLGSYQRLSAFVRRSWIRAA